MTIRKRFKDISIARKLYFTVGLMALLIALELGTLYFAINTLSAVRALVSAEGLWSKAQKDAAYHLQKYGRSQDEEDYQKYLQALRVNMGDRKTRLELIKPKPDMEVARQGFLEGRIHPDDIDPSLKLLMRFNQVSYISDAVAYWTKGDSLISELIEIGDQLHNEMLNPKPSEQRISSILAAIDPLNTELTRLEDLFSFTLGEGSRWLTRIILSLLLGLVLTVEICGLSLTVIVSRAISKGLNEIIRAAKAIEKGDYSTRSGIYSADEIGTLAHSFNSMADQLEKNTSERSRTEMELKQAKEFAENAAMVKERFLVNMSHEMRTPMNAVIGFTDLLEGTKLNREQSEYLRAIKVSGNSLLNLINDILDYSRLEAGLMSLDHKPFSVRTVFETLKNSTSHEAADKELKITFAIDDNIPRALLGDPKRLEQILQNLISNALKFTSVGEITVTARLKESTETFAVLEFNVMDTGPGIPESQQAMIFDRFTQVDSQLTRRHGGSGLGLSIVKSLVELQKGQIHLRSKVNEGAEFYFSIPYHKTSEQEGQRILPANGNSKPSASMKVLLAEDNVINQKLVDFVLKNNGIEVEIAENGKVALEMFKSGTYDLILMDMQMPEMDGYEATKYIREKLRSRIPIIALTAHAMSGEREKCLKLGMNDYISKPFNKEELIEKILQYSPS